MKISAIKIKNFKRIKEISIEPGADKAVLLIGGKNAQGKSSVLDALTAVFGGGKQAPSDPVRHGTSEASISVRLDDGIQIDRTYQADGKSALEVRSVEGAKFSSPQAMLDKLVGGRFLDPLAFCKLDAKKQRLTILELADKDKRIPGLDEKRKAAFEARTILNRDSNAQRTVADNLAADLGDDPGEPIDVAAEVAALAEFTKYESEYERSIAAMNAASEKEERAKQIVNDLQTKLDAANEAYSKAKIEAAAASARYYKMKAPDGDVGTIKSRLQNADAHNRRVNAYSNNQQRCAEAAAMAGSFGKQADEKTATIAEIDKRKAEILAAAKLPAGLTVGDDGLLLDGVAFDQASGAEQFGVALQLAIAANPKLHDVWIKDGALLDDEHLAALPALAESSGVRFWIERVGTRDAGVIVISDGTANV